MSPEDEVKVVVDVDMFMDFFKTKQQKHFKYRWFTDVGNIRKLAFYLVTILLTEVCKGKQCLLNH